MQLALDRQTEQIFLDYVVEKKKTNNPDNLCDMCNCFGFRSEKIYSKKEQILKQENRILLMFNFGAKVSVVSIFGNKTKTNQI